jgi:hypothetical protein
MDPAAPTAKLLIKAVGGTGGCIAHVVNWHVLLVLVLVLVLVLGLLVHLLGISDTLSQTTLRRRCLLPTELRILPVAAIRLLVVLLWRIRLPGPGLAAWDCRR